MTSLASVNGPSVTVRCPLEIRTGVLCAVGARPPLPSIDPSLTASSAMMLIASISSLGGGPEFSAGWTNIMNFIVISPFYFWVVGWALRTASSAGTQPSFICRTRSGEIDKRDIYFADNLRYLTLGLLLQLGKPSRSLLHIGREIRHFLHLAKLDHFIVRCGAARRPFHCFFLRLDLNHPVYADNL